MLKKQTVSAILSGFVCALCVFLYIQSIEADLARTQEDLLEKFGSDVRRVCVVTQDVGIGDVLTKQNSQVMEYPEDFIPDDSIQCLNEVEYRTVTAPIFKGEIVTTRHFEQVDKKKLVVPAGMVAVSVPAKDVEAVGGIVSAGARVDVYSTATQGTDLLIKDALVLDTSMKQTSTQNSLSENLAWLTLAVEPDAVEELITASHKSELYFVIKSEVAR